MTLLGQRAPHIAIAHGAAMSVSQALATPRRVRALLADHIMDPCLLAPGRHPRASSCVIKGVGRHQVALVQEVMQQFSSSILLQRPRPQEMKSSQPDRPCAISVISHHISCFPCSSFTGACPKCPGGVTGHPYPVRRYSQNFVYPELDTTMSLRHGPRKDLFLPSGPLQTVSITRFLYANYVDTPFVHRGLKIQRPSRNFAPNQRIRLFVRQVPRDHIRGHE